MSHSKEPSPSSANLPALARSRELSEARATLLTWYDIHKRDLPWRDIQDPWATWVSEIMLQQTRVSSVLEYFDRFMKRFPTPSALAEAEWDEVASLWAGLGYYRRAKNLWRGAQDVVERHDGVVPSDPDAVRALTGVGAYTAGAILSIAFGQRAPIVDGNVARVFSRLYLIEDEVQSASVQRSLWALAGAWADGERPGDLNQALMELGATICMPKSPTCLICPLSVDCKALSEGDPSALPRKRKNKRTPPLESYIAFVASSPTDTLDDAPTYWVERRSGEGLLSGLWSIPQRSSEPDATPSEDALESAWRDWMSSVVDQRVGPLAELEAESGERTWRFELLERPVEHRFTHKIWRLWIARVEGKPLKTLSHALDSRDDVTQMSVDELNHAGLGGPSLKALRAAGVQLKARRGSGVSAER